MKAAIWSRAPGELCLQCVHRRAPAVRIFAEWWPVCVSRWDLTKVRPARRRRHPLPVGRHPAKAHGRKRLSMVGTGKRKHFRSTGDAHRELYGSLHCLATTNAQKRLRQSSWRKPGKPGTELDHGHAVVNDVHRRKRRHLPGDRRRNLRIGMAHHCRTGRTRHSVEVNLAVNIPQPGALGSRENHRPITPQSMQNIFPRVCLVVHRSSPDHCSQTTPLFVTRLTMHFYQ